MSTSQLLPWLKRAIFLALLTSIIFNNALTVNKNVIIINTALNQNVINISTAGTETGKQCNDRDGVAFCLIQKNGEAYIDEWINYYSALGVGKVYVYDNSEHFDLELWAERRVNAGSNIQVTHFPGKLRQLDAYNDCVASIRRQNSNMQKNDKTDCHIQWVGFVDMDEFIVLKKHKSISELLHEHCPIEEQCGSLLLNWYMFSHSGETGFSPLPLTMRFQYREATVNQHVKSIVRVDYFKTTRGDPHCFKHSGVRFDTNGARASCPYNINGPSDVAVIHHIFTKSRAEYYSRQVRGSADINVGPDYAVSLPGRSSDEVFDDSAWQFLKQHFPAYEWYGSIGGPSLYSWGVGSDSTLH